MEDKITVKEFCKECGAELTPGHKGPCPKCGKTGKNIKAEIMEIITVENSLTGLKKVKYKKSEILLSFLGSLVTMIASLFTALIASDFFKGKFWEIFSPPLLIIFMVLIILGTVIYLYKRKKNTKQLRIERLKEIEKEIFQHIANRLFWLLQE